MIIEGLVRKRVSRQRLWFDTRLYNGIIRFQLMAVGTEQFNAQPAKGLSFPFFSRVMLIRQSHFTTQYKFNNLVKY